MTKRKTLPKRAVDAVEIALNREKAGRTDGLKPIEIVKIAICAFQEYAVQSEARNDTAAQLKNDAPFVESDDRAKIRRGTQSAIDALLFNANYWRSAYEDRIVAACSTPDTAHACLDAITVWRAHPLRLNTLSPEKVSSEFERFCPPFTQNNRRGAKVAVGVGKGPLPAFRQAIKDVAEKESQDCIAALEAVAEDIEAEATVYERLGERDTLDCLFDILPAWCLQDRIEFVNGDWWNDCDTMNLIIAYLKKQFAADGYGDAICQYFEDSCREAIDAYQRDVSSESSDYATMSIPELIEIVRKARDNNPGYEIDGYGDALPAWLISKEQLVWNTVVCAIYGPGAARPLLVDYPGMLGEFDNGGHGYGMRTDVITELAQTSFARYTSDRVASLMEVGVDSYSELPSDLRNSSIEHIRSIPGKVSTLGYEIVPLGTCYPQQRVNDFTTSEIECLAILEHRRWLKEREQAGWAYCAVKDIVEKKSPYMVPWEELPERAREWNRSAVRNIPALLASVGLAISR